MLARDTVLSPPENGKAAQITIAVKRQSSYFFDGNFCLFNKQVNYYLHRAELALETKYAHFSIV